MAENPESGIRLQKVLSHAGVASRRAAEEMITEGRVSVDGQVVTELGTRVDPRNAVIHVDGQRVPTAPDVLVLALNKPRGMGMVRERLTPASSGRVGRRSRVVPSSNDDKPRHGKIASDPDRVSDDGG